jgi:hypothetical protein
MKVPRKPRISNDLRLTLIIEAVRYCQKVRDLGMPSNA